MNVINKKRLSMILVAAAVLFVSGIFFIAQRRYFAFETRFEQGARILTVKAGGDFQQALNSARGGDTIVLEAGAKFVGPFTLPNKGAGESYVTIQSSRTSELTEGVRVKPDHSHLMPKLLSPGKGAAALQTAAGAHHYRFIGVEIGRSAPEAVVFDLVKLGDGSSAQNSLAQVPHHLTFDRCYVHGDTGDLKRGIALNSGDTEILNSYISAFHVRGQEAQALGGWNGPGPFRIVNNYVEGAGENLMFGGAQPSIPNLVPSDIEIRRNYFFKPASWRGIWTVKNLFELKNARRVVIDGNVFENCWLDAQQGYSILFTPRPNDSGAAAVVEDVQFTNNIVRHVAAALHLMGEDSLYTAGPSERRLHRVRIANNLFEDVNSSAWGGDGVFLKMVSGTDQVTVEHNTVVQTGNIIKSGGDTHIGFVFRDNIVRHNEFGVHGDGVGYGNPAINTYFPGSQFTSNLIAQEINAPWNTSLVYPAGNQFPLSYDQIGFQDLTNGNYRLSVNSPYTATGTNGTNPGCDFDALNAAMAGSSPPPPTPTPSPTPTPTASPTPTPEPSPSPSATPSPTPSPSPTPTPTTGPGVKKAKRRGQNLSNQLLSSGTSSSSGANGPVEIDSASRDALLLFINEIQEAQADFNAERQMFPAATRIELELAYALQCALDANDSISQGNLTDVRTHLRDAIDHLELSLVLIVYGEGVNPIDVASYMVRQHYIDFLDREPEEAGGDFWTNEITSCGTDLQCAEVKRIHVSAAFFLSIESQQTGFFVYRLYKSSYGRMPLRQEFIPDVQSVARGVIVGKQGWEADLAANKQAFLEDWVQRADFTSRYSSLSNGRYVDALIANLGVSISSQLRNDLVRSLSSGASRASVLGRLAENDAFSRAQFNSAFVMMQYVGYLRRDPDSGGFNFWLNKLNQFNGDYGRAEMVKAFLSSLEYRTRFSH